MSAKPQSKEYTTQVLDKLKQIGSMAGYELQMHENGEMLVAPFDMGNGRKQLVYLRYAGRTPSDQDVVAFLSPCLEIKKGFMKGIGRGQAIDILRRNAQLLFGQFGLFDFGDVEVLMSSSCQILETMEVEEFEAHLNCVAMVADSYEQEHGQDEF
ncbi:MAG: hypothetical protein GY856_01020 [bacterium]|nr:hypothetical protein [bacterium]